MRTGHPSAESHLSCSYCGSVDRNVEMADYGAAVDGMRGWMPDSLDEEVIKPSQPWCRVSLLYAGHAAA